MASTLIDQSRDNTRFRVCPNYEYDKEDPNVCPACKGFGGPINGWFLCSCCPAVAKWETGEVFLPESRKTGPATIFQSGQPKRDPYEKCGFNPEYLDLTRAHQPEIRRRRAGSKIAKEKGRFIGVSCSCGEAWDYDTDSITVINDIFDWHIVNVAEAKGVEIPKGKQVPVKASFVPGD